MYQNPGGERPILLDEGYRRVKEEGVSPFLNLVETGESQFFKAKEFVNLYDLIFKMCIQRDPHNWSADMYQRYKGEIIQYINKKVVPALEAAKAEYDTTLLREWVKRWQNHKMVVQGLGKLFMYLDRFYTPNTDGVNHTRLEGYTIYKGNVFDNFSQVAANAILNAIQRERVHENVDRQLLASAVSVFVEMGHRLHDSTNHDQKTQETKLKVYKNDLEKNLLKQTATHYHGVGKVWLDQDSCPTYLRKADEAMNAERDRVEAYLNQNSKEALVREVYTKLLHDNQHELLSRETGVFHMLAQNMTEDLSRLYRLYKLEPADLEPIGRMVKQHIQKIGLAIVEKHAQSSQQATGDHSLVVQLIKLHEQYADVVKNCFGRNQTFQKALKAAFEDFINKDPKLSKLLARFVHDVLKKGTKVAPKDVEPTLNNVVFIYGYITEKDYFERDYQVFLAQRLLNGLCESEFNEKMMIAKLKAECGYQWTSKLEGMFKDIAHSKELMVEFKRKHNTEKLYGVALDVAVVTPAFWPNINTINAKELEDVKPLKERFELFYKSKHNGHELKWMYDEGKAEVQVFFTTQMKRGLIVSTHQMMILLVFNNAKIVSAQQICDVTGLTLDQIGNDLLSLCHPKVAVLLKKPNNKELSKDHRFMINGKFQSRLFKVPIPRLNLYKPERKDGNEPDPNHHIKIQRQHQMDAGIVRIMKTRKKLKHNLLLTEVIEQLKARFRPKPAMIKKRIEALIELEYLARDENERNTYKYLA